MSQRDHQTDHRTAPVNGQKIVRLRHEKGWTQDDLAERSGISKRAIEEIEKGGRALPRNVATLAQTLGVETKDLLIEHESVRPSASQVEASLFKPGSAPPLPSLIIGREDALRELKARLGISAGSQSSATVQVLTAVRGWPGVGKTTLAAALAHDPEIAAAFPDGVLWASLGQNPDLLSELAAWGRALGTDDLLRVNNLEEASARLTALLRNKRMLIIVDDAWETQHAMPFKVGGRGCAMLITTRITSVAQAIAPTAKDVYRLAVLSPENSLELLRQLAPEVVTQYPNQSLELVRELEGLPLAIQVAGHLLNAEASAGLGITELLAELREGARILIEKAPAGYTDIENQVIPTVAVLLQKSTDYLDQHTRDCFAYLGAFAPKPATFDLAAMKAVWEVDDPAPTARSLVDRGLLEPVAGRFQMHALLVTHARSLLTWE
jgi:transcriptional regulator with XRE-family HTH domain